ncbi:MAG: hypothetical protein AAFY06_14820 [Pseudomonadota bacterium]
MSSKKKTNPVKPSKSADTREDRLKAALKANLQRRKAQGDARGAKTGAEKEAK